MKKKIIIDKVTGLHYYELSGRLLRAWTEAEKSTMRRLYPNTTLEDLCGIFRASKKEVSRFATKLGLHKDPVFLKAYKGELARNAIYQGMKNGNWQKHTLTPEMRKMASERSKGKPLSEELKAKIAKGLKRHYHNPENRKRQSENQKRYIEENKEEFLSRIEKSLITKNRNRGEQCE